ncbi:interleukin-6 receptor subunit beta-like isoform X1 [Conger conger]|uniref:interleukin-6 receptor subunit beta-like isoform X1 n=1 Tax=Conger conger TaxID=82655 RepID=UPI002A5A6195|nr:interleukin-6 receptor subunit beta-like isoform X1 [Conger conger]
MIFPPDLGISGATRGSTANCAKGRMFSSTFLLLFIAVVVCRDQNENEKCEVYPKDPVVSKGDNIRVMFRAPDNSLCGNFGSYSPEKVFWMLNDEKINETLYTMVNSTIPAVDVQNFTVRTGTVTCHIYVEGKNTILGGTNIKLHVPPEKPTNVSCVTVITEGFTCYWHSGEDTLSDTTYTVTRRVHWFNATENDSCTSRSSPCSFPDLLFSSEVWVTARSSQGEANSDVLDLKDIYSTVKLSPPQKVKAERPFNTVELTWEGPKIGFNRALVYEVQYSYQQGGPSHKRVTNSTRLRINLETPCTRYTISVRCAVQAEHIHVWSDWSPDTTVISPLDVHSMDLLLWRKIQSDESGNRTVQLMWKGVPTSCDAIDGYRVTLKAENNRTTVLFNTTRTKASITVDKEAYTVKIVTYRRENILSEDTTTIPALDGEGFLPVEAAHVSSHNGQINVSWRAPSQSHTSYMVDWSTDDDDDYSWQETKTTNIAFSGQPLKLYKITVTPLYSKSSGPETILKAYAKEGAPGAVPWVNVTDVGTEGALVRWAAVPPNACCGFTVNYTVFYRPGPGPGPEESVTVPGTQQRVRLGRLRSGTTYTVHVMASSIAGGTNSSDSVFTTPSYGSHFIIMLWIFGGLAVVLLPMIVLCCFIIQKKHILKSVPNPRDSDAVSWPSSYSPMPLLLPCEESYSEKPRVSMRDGCASPSPTSTETALPVSPDQQPDPASDLGPCAMKCPQEPIRSPPYLWECPAPGEWDGGKKEPVSPYLENCIPSVKQRVYPCGEKACRSTPNPQGFSATMPAYVSVEGLQEGLLNPVPYAHL